jgi:hypothetical protein
MTARRAGAALAAALVAAWSSCALALDRAGAIEAAKRQAGSRCSTAASCTFDAKLENNQWTVRVQFPEGHAIYIFNQSGKVVGTVTGR